MSREILLQKYFQAELSEEEQELLIQYLEEDEEFAADAKLQSMMYVHRSRGLKAFLSKDKTPSSATPLHKKTKLIKLVRNIAAIFIFACMAYFLSKFLYVKEKTNILSDIYSERYIAPGQIQSSTDEVSKWQRAKTHYSTENYRLAEKEILGITNPTIEQQLYLGLSLMYKDPPDFKASIPILKKIRDNPNYLDNDAASWYLGIAYLRSNQIDMGLSIIDSIASTNHYKKAKAVSVLEYFKDI